MIFVPFELRHGPDMAECLKPNAPTNDDAAETNDGNDASEGGEGTPGAPVTQPTAEQDENAQ